MAKDANETKAVSKAEEKKPNFFVRAFRSAKSWLHDMKVELKKVHWPSRSELLKNCLVVLACIVIIGACIWIFDALAAAVIKALVNLFQG
jgi:preprotein translocase subunit SecE